MTHSRRRWLASLLALISVLVIFATHASASPAPHLASFAAMTGAAHHYDPVMQEPFERAGSPPTSARSVAAQTAVGSSPTLATTTGVAAEADATVVEAERLAVQALKPSEAATRWDEFLGDGPATNIHPRTGLLDANRIVSSDGTRSIRFGDHEMESSPTRSHYHEETWNFDPGENSWFVDNLMVRVPFPKGSW